jgi:hypothetical protein
LWTFWWILVKIKKKINLAEAELDTSITKIINNLAISVKCFDWMESVLVLVAI